MEKLQLLKQNEKTLFLKQELDEFIKEKEIYLKRSEDIKNTYEQTVDELVFNLTQYIKSLEESEEKALNISLCCDEKLRRRSYSNEKCNKNYITFECSFIDKTTLKQSFGSDFTLEIGEKKISINHGCVGYFSSEDIYLVKRIQMINSIFKNEKTILQMFNDGFSYIPVKEYDTYENQKAKLEIAIKTLTDKLTVELVKANLEKGFIFTCKGNDTFKVTKVTEKNVYFVQGYRYYHFETDSYGDWEYNENITPRRMDLDLFVYYLNKNKLI